jgi:hypothetical protein
MADEKAGEVQKKIDAFIQNGKKDKKKLGELLKVLEDIAKTGLTSYSWPSIRSLLLVQLQNVIDDYMAAGGKGNDLDGETFDQRLKRVQDYLGKFPRAPFTLQRMAELLVEPKRYYSNPSKFFLAFSKLVCGISARNFDQEAADEESESKKNSMSSFFNPPVPLAGSTPMDFTSSFSTTTVMPTTFASTSASSTLLSGTSIATGPPIKKKKTEDDKDGVEGVSSSTSSTSSSGGSSSTSTSTTSTSSSSLSSSTETSSTPSSTTSSASSTSSQPGPTPMDTRE